MGAPFFNATISPLVIPMVLGMILGPLMKWGRDDLKQIFLRLKPIIFINFLLMLLVWYLAYRGPVIAIIFIALAIWLATSSLFEIYQLALINLKKKTFVIPLKTVSQALAHFGIAILIIGATGTSILKKENIQFQEVGEAISTSGYEVKFMGVSKEIGTNYKSDYAKFELYKNGELVSVLNPEKRIYNFGKQVTTEARNIFYTAWGYLYFNRR